MTAPRFLECAHVRNCAYPSILYLLSVWTCSAGGQRVMVSVCSCAIVVCVVECCTLHTRCLLPCRARPRVKIFPGFSALLYLLTNNEGDLHPWDAGGGQHMRLMQYVQASPH